MLMGVAATMSFRRENLNTSTNKCVKALSEMFEQLAKNNKPINKFNSKWSADFRKSNKSGTGKTIGSGLEGNGSEPNNNLKKSARKENTNCRLIVHELKECRSKGKEAEDVLQNPSTIENFDPYLYSEEIYEHDYSDKTATNYETNISERLVQNNTSTLENEISPLNNYEEVDAITNFSNPIYDYPINEGFISDGQNFEEPVESLLPNTLDCELEKKWIPLKSRTTGLKTFNVLIDETKEDIFGSTSFENNQFSIEVFNYKSYTIINKISINIVEIALDNKGLTNINPSQISTHNQAVEWFNQNTFCDGSNSGLFENKDTIVKLIEELKLTERTYILDLNYVITEYLKYFRGYSISCVFGNIEDIYEHSLNFYRDLCLCGHDSQKIAETFLTYDVLFEIYVQYIRNHTKCISYLYGTYMKAIEDRSKVLKDQYSIESHLLKPYQRLTRHRLLLQNIEKLHEAGKPRATISQAVLYLNIKLNRANTLVAIDTIKDCPFDLTNKGDLLLQDTFTTKRKNKVQAFLFEEVIVFTEVHEDEKNSFSYKSFIAMNRVYPIPTRNYDTIVLTFKSVNGKHVESIEIETPSEAIRKKWITCINKLLFDQLKQAKDRQKSLDIF